MDFYVQLHMHTSETSRCGVDSAAQMVRACKRAGYGLIVITDHFFNANIDTTPGMSWPEKVERLMRGYRAARAEGEKIGLTVLFGWETFTGGGPEYLTYGLDDKFLLKNQGIERLPPRAYLKAVRSHGAFVSHAHPFREAFYIPQFTPIADEIDAVEVYNAAHRNPEWNRKALDFARREGLIELAGADAHEAGHVALGAMRLDRPVRTMDELIGALRSGDAKVVERLPGRAS
jgi:predicted metal-dependent phosphoesterase TrpH